jgi:putative phosphoribosyl transferase
MMLFKDRADAGRKLAQELPGYGGRTDVIVLGLPRGGVPVAFEVAKALKAPLDIFLVRKLGAPGQKELAMGAIAPGGVRVLNHDVVQALNISDEIIETIAAEEQQELERREQAYRGDRPKPDVRGRTVILVDDGLATGASMRAAVIALRGQEPARIIVAVPTAAPETCEALKGEVDEIVCVATPQPFLGIGASYEEFSQMTDEEVRELIEQASSLLPAG